MIITGYTLIMIKLILGIICLVFQINLMGKGNLAPNSAVDQVQNYVLGGIIGGVIYTEAIGVLQFLLVLIGWTIVVMGLRFLTNYSRFVKKLVDGNPVIVVDYGVIQVEECMKHGVNAGDLHLKLRAAGIARVGEVKRAVLEQNGQLTVVKYGEDTVHYPLIADGLADENVLSLVDKDRAWLEDKVAAQGYTISEVYMAELVHGELAITPYAK
ncbi:DUF421 domain-containing protein [uncultured Veillonella sp.]|uniref:DUF421 domain-containing protein n=1 Tax=uncultured Veillonella sp. TaxID=159268 RepID=UPI00261E0580|nr:DUF421 domain-containing protein [uncultured Veillonella sp.]